PEIDYDHLRDLSEFPALIPKADVMKILHATEEEYQRLISDPSQGLKAVGAGGYVIRSSLEVFLGLKGP
ncbi:MAG: hypothetical protein HYY26_01340, partial [Acidobacteria bacterium]|nr:hypothetical protein [Acidobacteriota bacterium]